MAACDSKYKFTLFDVAAFGCESDGGILSRSVFGKALYESKLNFPKGKYAYLALKRKHLYILLATKLSK